MISQETWDKFTEEEKEKIIEKYKELSSFEDDNDYIEGKTNILVSLFGEENLQPKPKIKTWADIEEIKDSHKSMVGYLLNFSNDIELNKKLAATFQIKLLIELGYGGIVTDEEWRNYKRERFWGVECEEHTGSLVITPIEGVRAFPSFHTQQQAEEFMSYPENVELVKQYHMI